MVVEDAAEEGLGSRAGVETGGDSTYIHILDTVQSRTRARNVTLGEDPQRGNRAHHLRKINSIVRWNFEISSINRDFAMPED